MGSDNSFTPRQLATAFQQAGQRQFSYVSDMEKNGEIERWESEEDRFLEGEIFYGDCDTYALTLVRAINRITQTNTRDYREGN